MAAKKSDEIRNALQRGDLNLVQALGISVQEEALLAEQGYELMKDGKLIDAQQIFEGLALLNPQNSYYPTALGNIKKAMDLPNEAIPYLERAVQTNPNDLSALMSLADTYLRQKEKRKALPRLLQILYVDSEKKSDQGREANNILQKYFSKDEIRAYVEAELGKLPGKK
jgi:thioredoxin-like negative regulator of GroEL